MYAVSGLIVGAVLIIIVVVITATGCYFYSKFVLIMSCLSFV